jgi:hypothetical protein
VQPVVPSADPQLIESKQLVSRKKQQLVHLEAYDEAVVELKAKVKEIEGQDMREAIQDKVRRGPCHCIQLQVAGKLGSAAKSRMSKTGQWRITQSRTVQATPALGMPLLYPASCTILSVQSLSPCPPSLLECVKCTACVL